jgi:FKBP-type peptidyl-prolyl cis-trans isomerase
MVVVETITPGIGPAVTRNFKYRSMVTLYIEHTKDGTRTPSGWSTRQSDGATVDQPFEFQPGMNLIAGWTEGVLKMKEGERALLHVPAAQGYGNRPMGQPGGAFYIPANSDLLFDIEILGKVGQKNVSEL